MQKSVEALKTSLSKIRTGRARTSACSTRSMVDYYGSMVPISQVANITVQDARTIRRQPSGRRRWSQVVEKAIRESDLGLNPSSLGELIRVPMPPLSEERRRELTKVVKHEGEHAKVSVRNLRRDANEQIKELLKAKEISEDDDRRAQDDVQKLTDRFVVEIDRLLTVKEQEIMTV